MAEIPTDMLLLWSILIPFAAGSTVNCYSCSYVYSGDPTLTYECVSDPGNVTRAQPIISCTQHCTISRQWDGSLNGERGAIRSFTRGCGPSGGNQCEDEIYTSRKNCFTSCRENLCNSGSGYDPQDPTNMSDPDVEGATGGDTGGNIEDDNNDDNNDNNNNRGNDNNRRYYDPNSAANSHFATVLYTLPILVLLTRIMVH